MLKPNIKKPRQFIAPLLSKKSIIAGELEAFVEATEAYLTKLETQLVTRQSEPNIVSNALKPFCEQMGYIAQSHSQSGQSGMDLTLIAEHVPAVIIEAKVPDAPGMITTDDLNHKALHEAILYFMRERDAGNNTLYHVIITDFYRWFVFDAGDFERHFWRNPRIQKIYQSVKDPSVLGSRTEDFYTMVGAEIARMGDDLVNDTLIDCAYVDLRKSRSDKETIALYKLLTPDTLFKAFNPNDANTLDKAFYHELLYLLGLQERTLKGKKLIERSPDRHRGALYENIVQKLSDYGKPTDFESVIRLMIIWINRILFLKLLESQLIRWNDSETFAFLNRESIWDFDRLEMFFFDILAKRPQERGHREFDHVPYLNSSLFEMNPIESTLLTIATLQDDCDMPYYPKTVLRDAHGRRKEGTANMLHYLFEFLDAYDFASEGSEELVHESKSLINASVLGLIFEKLNGYKDGSFYTPSFITMYMSRETITPAVIAKFNAAKGWHARTLEDLDDLIEDKHEANAIIDTLTACDPAVGSGHFLVSTLNTILEIKSRLRILHDAEGRRIKDYELRVENDELIVRDDEGELFEYKRNAKEKTRIQKMLFTEKQKIIENSLFGVDINPNSAQITRLRLWIELLKHSYYSQDGTLVTMPNIDINIKVGNSLISRYALDTNTDDIDIDGYKQWVSLYKSTNNKEVKAQVEKSIQEIKKSFKTKLHDEDKQIQKLKNEIKTYIEEFGFDGIDDEMILFAPNHQIFVYAKNPDFVPINLMGEHVSKLNKDKLYRSLKKRYDIISEIEKGKIYEEAFEWRFEFPEVLDGEGNFIGFDVVIGNPPYIALSKLKEIDYGRLGYATFDRTGDILALFVERSAAISRAEGIVSLIVSNSWLKTRYGEHIKTLLARTPGQTRIINFEDTQIFEEATVETCILTHDKAATAPDVQADIRKFDPRNATIDAFADQIEQGAQAAQIQTRLMEKIKSRGKPLGEWDIDIYRGVLTGFNQAFIIDNDTRDRLIQEDPASAELLKPLIRGRDVQKYQIEWAGKWLIASLPALEVSIDHYPAIKSYLRSFGKRLEQTGEKGSRKKTHNQWFEIQDTVAYYKYFAKPKIIWGEISDKPKFSYDDSGKYVEVTGFIMTGEHLKYLLAILNSKFSMWYFEKISTTTGMGTNRWKKFKLLQLPIAQITDTTPFETLVESILEAKHHHRDTTDLEAQIDRMVYELYELNDDEIAVVEGRG